MRILQIVVPHSELSSFHDRDDRDITWLPSPPEGSVSVASVFVSEQGMQLEGPPDGVTLVGTVRTSIRTAWLVYSYHPIAEGTAKLLDDERMKLRGKLEAEGVTCPPGTRVALWDSRDDHDRHVLELACP